MREPRSPDTIFWVEPSAISGDHLSLDAEESHHLLRVHRAAPGAPFTAIDGAGVAYECVLESAGKGLAVGRIVRRESGVGEPPVPITLLVGLPDAGPAESIVEHAVPLGATFIDFLAAARSGRPPLKPARLARLLRLARAGLKQSRRTRLPGIASSPSLEEALSALKGGHRFVADPAGHRLLGGFAEGRQDQVILAVGPPGGFDEREQTLLRGAQFKPIALASNRLTTETAALALLAVVRNLLM